MFYKQWNAESVFYSEDSCWGLCNWNPSQFPWGEGQWQTALCTHLCSYSVRLLTVDEWLSIVWKVNPGTEVIDKHCYKSTLLDCKCLFILLLMSDFIATKLSSFYWCTEYFFFILKAGPRKVFFYFFYFTKSSLIYVCFGGNGTGYKFCAGEQKGKQTHPSVWESTAVFKQLGHGQTFATVKVAVRHPALYLPPG